MPKGESSRDKVRLQIQKLLLNGPANSRRIVEACDATKTTTYKYLNELYEEGKVTWKPARKRGESTYELSNEAKEEITLLMEKQKITAKIEQMTPQKTQEFMKFLSFLEESKEGEEFWVWLPDLDRPEIIKKYKHVETKILVQDL